MTPRISGASQLEVGFNIKRNLALDSVFSRKIAQRTEYLTAVLMTSCVAKQTAAGFVPVGTSSGVCGYIPRYNVLQ